MWTEDLGNWLLVKKAAGWGVVRVRWKAHSAHWALPGPACLPCPGGLGGKEGGSYHAGGPERPRPRSSLLTAGQPSPFAGVGLLEMANMFRAEVEG